MSSAAMDMTACQIVDAIGTGTDINSFPGNGILKIASVDQVKSAECVDVQCTNWAVKRMILSNEETKAHWQCGFAIMGFPVVCPTTTVQCQNAKLYELPSGQQPADFYIDPQAQATSGAFAFPDHLSIHCNQAQCTVATHDLKCYSCSSCSNPTACSGTCSPATAVTAFTYTFNTVAATKQFTVTIDDNLNSPIDHKCFIEATLGTQTKQSAAAFRIKENCVLCTQTVFIASYKPTFSSPVPIGSTGVTQNFNFFDDSASLCGRTPKCTSAEYTIYCKDSADPAATFKTVNPDGSDGWRPSLSAGTQMALSVVSQSLNFHLKTMTCKIKAVHLESLGQEMESDTFDISFSACVNADQSCALNEWKQPPSGWIAPQSFSVFLDGSVGSTSFLYDTWLDKLSTVCSVGYCGAISYSYVNSTDILQTVTIPSATVSIVDDTIAKRLTISVSTTSILSVWQPGYKCKILGKQAGRTLTIEWDASFTIDVVNPCTLSNPCRYTNIIASTTAMSSMTVYLDDVQVDQDFSLFDDSVSLLCAGTVSCTNKSYQLVYTADLSEVGSDLAISQSFSVAIPQIQAKTTNYLYTGTKNVQVKCTYTKSDGSTSYGLGQAFDIHVIACDTKSCKSTQLIDLVSPPDTLMQSFSIGTGDIVGTTTFTNYKDTVGSMCTANPTICGTPSYKVIYSDNTEPSFTSLSTGAALTTISAQTTDVTKVGEHKVRVEVTQTLPAPLGELKTHSSEFTITVDKCTPLPCSQNKIISPTASASFALPGTVGVVTNGTVSIAEWDEYQDEISVRCSGSAYTNLCGNKNYQVTKTDGTALPFTVTVTKVGTKWQMSASTTDTSLIGDYEVLIHAAFDTATALGSASDDKSHKFYMYVELPDPCMYLNCLRNSLITARTGYTEPKNFTVDISYQWNKTAFDRHNDTKHESCWNKPGSKQDGTVVTSWPRPVCGYPLYELVDATTNKPMTSVFGDGNILIEFQEDLEYTTLYSVAARTSNKMLDGDYKVKLAVKLNEFSTAWTYLDPFWITVEDPCKPYDCSVTRFFPLVSRPANIKASYNTGYTSSAQSMWSDTVTNQCSTGAKLCGSPTFELYMADGTEIPFDYTVYQSTSAVIVSVKVTDENLIGQTFEVALRGYGTINGVPSGVNGTTDIFEITVQEQTEQPSYIVSTEEPPLFTQFPPDIIYRIGQNDQGFQIQEQTAIAYSASGIASVKVDLGVAVSFVTAQIEYESAEFKIRLDQSLKVGRYSISVEATDKNGLKTTKKFFISIQQFQQSKESEEDQLNNKIKNSTIEPLQAKIESISLGGLMTITYNRRVVPLTNVTWITSKEFHARFEQRSDEVDQTEEFTYKVIRHTPINLYVQLTFFEPLAVSQGIDPDLVHIDMIRSLFMVEDIQGVYAEWVEGEPIQQTTFDVETIRKGRNWGNFANQTIYQALSEKVPKQAANPQQAAVIYETMRIVNSAFQALLWGPLALHLAGFGQMEYTWVIFNQLQVVGSLSQFDLKLPVNVQAITQSYADFANGILLPQSEIYEWLRFQTSDSENPEINAWGNPIMDMTGATTTGLIDGGDGERRLQETAAETSSEFEKSRFYGKAATDYVLETTSQLIVLLLGLMGLGLLGIFLQKSFLFLFSARMNQLFHWLRMRIFWCFPLRMLLQNYMCITFAAFLNLKFQNKDTSTEQKVNVAFSYIVLLIYSVGFIVFIYLFVRKYSMFFLDNTLKRRFDSIYMSVEIEKKWALPQVAFYLIKKFLLIFVAVNIEDNILQICLALYISEIYTIYILYVKPMNRRSRNLNEQFNEITIILLLIILSLLTDFVPASVRYQVGNFVMGMIYLQVFVNSVFLMVDVIGSLGRVYKILRFKYVMRERAKQVRTHNKTVDEIDKNRNSEQHLDYKKRVPIAKPELKVIESVGSEPSSSLDSIVNNYQATNSPAVKTKTITARKREFDQMMLRMRQNEQHTVKAPVFMTTEEPDIEEFQSKFLERAQQDNDWPISPRYAQNQLLPAIQDRGNFDFAWQSQGHASDWYAVPEDFHVGDPKNNFSIFSHSDAPESVESLPVSKTPQMQRQNQLVVRSDLDYSVPDANQNSKEHSKWKEDDSMLVERKDKKPPAKDQVANDEIEWSFN